MSLFRRKDPLKSRDRALKARLADLESQIEQLDQAGTPSPETHAAVHELKPGDEPLPPRPNHPLSEQPLGTAESQNETLWQWFSRRFRKWRACCSRPHTTQHSPPTYVAAVPT